MVKSNSYVVAFRRPTSACFKRRLISRCALERQKEALNAPLLVSLFINFVMSSILSDNKHMSLLYDNKGKVKDYFNRDFFRDCSAVFGDPTKERPLISTFYRKFVDESKIPIEVSVKLRSLGSEYLRDLAARCHTHFVTMYKPNVFVPQVKNFLQRYHKTDLYDSQSFSGALLQVQW